MNLKKWIKQPENRDRLERAVVLALFLAMLCAVSVCFGDETFAGKVYLDGIGWYQFTQNEVIYRGENHVYLYHEEDEFGTTWSCLDGSHDINLVVFYGEEKKDEEGDRCALCDNPTCTIDRHIQAGANLRTRKTSERI